MKKQAKSKSQSAPVEAPAWVAAFASLNKGTNIELGGAFPYGSMPPITFPTDDKGGVATIDRSFLQGKKDVILNVRLKHIKECLRLAGKKANKVVILRVKTSH